MMSRRALVCCAVGLVLIFGTGAGWAATPRSVFVMAKSLDDLISLDPAEVFEFSGSEVIANLYQRLFRPNPEDPANPVGDVVEAWEVAADGRTFTFAVRPGLIFASGRAITARDAAFSLRRAVALNKAPSFILTQFGLVPETVDTAIRVLDDVRFSIRLDRAYAPTLVLNALSAGIASVVDQSAIKTTDEDPWGHAWLRTRAAGSGGFTLRRWRAGEFLLLDTNQKSPGAPSALRRVVIRDIREPATQRLLLERGDIDMARNLGPDQIAALRDEDGVTVVAVPRGRLFYLGLNQQNENLSRPGVRRAMRYLIDYQAIAERLLVGRATVHQTFLPRGFFGALDETPFAFDAERARALLAEAGLADGFAATMDTRSDPIAMLVAQAIQATMAAAGIAIEIIPGNGKQVLTRYRARRHDIFIGQWGPDYLDPHTNAATFARNPDNGDEAAERTLAWRNGWEIPDLTRRAEQAVTESDPAHRAEIYEDLQRAVQADSPFIVMFQENELIAMRDTVVGFKAGLTADQTDYRAIEKRR
jgi:peptide/nickel transport system substrate-binding protein